MMGGISASAHGGSRYTTHDIDFFVKQQDAEKALTALASAGFNTEKRFRMVVQRIQKERNGRHYFQIQR